jgi:hypothetical protein
MADRFQTVVAYKTLNLLIENKAILYEGRKAFWVWSLDGRALVIFDPAMVNIGKLNDKFAHDLSTRLNGRLVVRTNSRGLFLQVDPQVPTVAEELIAKPLNLAEQPSPYHMGIGSSARGDLWISLLEADSLFVVGMRGMGKTGELHAMIQSLLHGGQTKVYAWDGKENAEYLRYVGREHFTLLPMDGLQQGLELIQAEVTQRMRKLAMSGHPNIVSYNAHADAQDYMAPIALIIDEVAEVDDQALLLKQVKVNRAAGVYPIFATNDPSKAAVIAKSNLGTRISFKVISTPDSLMGLGQTGANHLPNTCGRGLIVHNGRLVEFQSFTVEYPKPTEAGMQWLKEQQEKAISGQLLAVSDEQSGAGLDPEADRILAMIEIGKSDSAIVREVFGVSGGGQYYKLINRVKALRPAENTSSSSTSVLPEPILGLEGAV